MRSRRRDRRRAQHLPSSLTANKFGPSCSTILSLSALVSEGCVQTQIDALRALCVAHGIPAPTVHAALHPAPRL
eukprot:3415149-Rhodomonas_salina.2